MALKMSTENGGIQAMSLRGLDEDHEAEGTKMATSITTWLDAEVGGSIARSIMECIECTCCATRVQEKLCL